MKGKQSLAVVISTILSLAGVTGCSTTPEVKQTVKYQQNNRGVQPRKIARHVNDKQIYNEIYADALLLGFGKQRVTSYKPRQSRYQRQQAAKRRQAPRYKRPAIRKAYYTKKYKRQAPRYNRAPKRYVRPVRAYKRPPPRRAAPRRYVRPVQRYVRPAPRYTRPAPRYTRPVQRYIRPAPRYTRPVQRYIRPAPRYTRPVQRYVRPAPRYTRPVQRYIRPVPRQRQVVRTNIRPWIRPAVHRPMPRFQPRNNPQQYNTGNMWNRIKGGFRMGTELHNPTVQKVLRQYTSKPARLNRIFSRSTEYMHFILYELKRRNMPTELALLPMVESAFKNRAVSRSGAAGMWQFMPATGKDFGLRRARSFDARMDIFASTRAALTYLQKINRQFNGDWYLTLAAYNVGQNRIHRERAKNRAKGRRSDYWSLSLPQETREYVPRLLAYKEILLHPQKYGVHLPRVSNNAVITQTNVNRPIDLRQAARMAGLPTSTLVRLNPNFKNGVTNPRLSRKVVLPRQFARRLHHAIQKAPTVRVKYRPKYRATYKSRSYKNKGRRIIRHRVRRGETLHNIAARYGTSIAKIMHLNKMHSTRLIKGTRLKIAVRRTSRYRS